MTLPQGALNLDGAEQQANHSVPGKLCDCLVFVARGAQRVAAAIELKGKHPDVPDAVEQLQGGAERIEELLEGESAAFFAVLATSGLGTTEAKILQRRSVRFRGKDYPIQKTHCSGSLQELVERSSHISL